jgi:AcrR family transcriptional regulator
MSNGSADTEREDLCRALTRVVAEHGWSGASVRRVSLEAGIPPAEFYDHFRSLEHCYATVYRQMLLRVRQTAFRMAVARSLDIGRGAWEDQLEAVFTGMLAFFSLEPALARTCLVEVYHAGPDARRRHDVAIGLFTSYVEGLRLTHGEPMPPLAAEMIVLGTVELMQQRVRRGESDGLPELLPELRQLWRGAVEECSEQATVVSAATREPAVVA